ncbi:MAG: pyridoxal phosphate-dependent aminotransferase [Gemmatimonadales bacterium]
MTVSRRAFIATLGAGGAGVLASPLIHARGREGSLYAFQGVQGVPDVQGLPGDRKADRRLAAAPGMIRLDSNENPVGPGDAALNAIRRTLAESNRYPVLLEDELKETIAKLHGVKPENVILGCGSGELLRSAVQAFTAADRAFVAPAPTFETPGVYAKFIGTPVKGIPVDAQLSADLGAMAEAARDAGLVYLCNPNNPTATVHTKADVEAYITQVGRVSPQTTVLVDEAYFEYVELPGYGTVVPTALANPRVVVARTFSKVFGMAGLRVGYAVGQPATLAKMSSFQLGSNVSQLSLAAAIAALRDTEHVAREQRRNREVKAFTRKFFAGAGYAMSAGEANFMMVDIRRDAKAFKAECLKKGVAVGRAFPPLNTQVRLSFGTMPEMKKALEVFRSTLA